MDLKELHPLETDEYAVSQSIERKHAFNWWVPFVLKKRAHIISLFKQRSEHYLKHNEKYGINLPKTVYKAQMLDKENGNTLWSNAIMKDMTNVKVAFNFFDDDDSVPRNHQFFKFHMIFDVKMKNFRLKARLVAGGHTTKAPAVVTYAIVVSRETVCIALTIAALNNLQVKCGDVLNAYITAPVTELIWTTLAPEFGYDQGRTAIVVRDFYDLKSSSAAFHKNLGECMSGIGYKTCLADPDLWLNLEVRDDGVEYYSCILCYVNEILVVYHNTRPDLDRNDQFMKLKEGSVGYPDIYSGAKSNFFQMSNNVWCWSLSPSKYVQDVV